MGGTVVMETSVDDSLVESLSEQEITAGIQAGYDGIVNSGKLSVETAFNNSQFLRTHREKVSVRLDVVGGVLSSEDDIHQWHNSIFDTPSILFNTPNVNNNFTELVAISALVGQAGLDDRIARNINSLIKAYMIPAELRDGLLTQAIPVDFNRVSDAKRGDGFYVASVKKKSNGDRGYIKAFSAAGGNPSILRATASQHFFTHEDDVDHQVPSAALTMPVPKNHASTVVDTATALEPDYSLNFIGLGDVDDSILGEYQKINLDQTYTFEQPGFVVAYIDWGGADGSRGYIVGQQQLPGIDHMIDIVGASEHNFVGSDIIVPTNSFYMPVPAGNSVRVAFFVSAITAIAEAFFIPITNELVELKPVAFRNPDLTYQAQTDGFLTAMLFPRFTGQFEDGDRGHVDIYSSPDPNFTGVAPLASTSIHFFGGSDTIVPYGSATIPVAKGNYYKADFKSTALDAQIAMHWIALGN